MSRIRFSMTSLMLFVVLCAVTFAVFRFSSGIWSSILFSLVILVLFTSVIAATYSAGSQRAFWVGFALFGCGYWFVVHVPWSQGQAISSSMAMHLYQQLEPHIFVTPSNRPSGPTTASGMSRAQAISELHTVCNSWMTLAFAIAGGFPPPIGGHCLEDLLPGSCSSIQLTQSF
jgi:hypothetical protein